MKKMSTKRSSVTGTVPKHPKHKLAAVSKKKAEIEELLPSIKENLPTIKSLYTEYLIKVETLFAACGDSYRE